MPEMRKSTLYTSFWGRTGVIVAVATLLLSVMLPAAAIAGGGDGPFTDHGGGYMMGGEMGYPARSPDYRCGYGYENGNGNGDDNGDDNGNGAHCGDDDFHKTIYPRNGYSAMAYKAEPGYGPDPMGGMPKMGGEMAYKAEPGYGPDPMGGMPKMGGEMAYPGPSPDYRYGYGNGYGNGYDNGYGNGDDNGDDNGNGAHHGDDDFHKTIYPRDDFSAMAYQAEPDHGPVKMRGMSKMDGGMGYPGPDHGGKMSYAEAVCTNSPHPMDEKVGMGGGAWWVCDDD